MRQISNLPQLRTSAAIGHIDVAVALGNHAEVFLANLLTAGGKLGDSDGWVIMGSSNLSDQGLGTSEPPRYEGYKKLSVM